MPVHFESFISDKNEELKNKLLADILEKYTEQIDSIVASEDKTKLHSNTYFKDTRTKRNIGKVVLSFLIESNQMQIVDIDIVLLTKNKTALHFENKLEQSSLSNKYYLVCDTNQERHFDIETVNRQAIVGDIENTVQETYLSAFPFQVNIYENEKELNQAFGMKKKVNIPGMGATELKMDTRMMGEGQVMVKAQEPCSFVIGQVQSIKDVKADIAGNLIPFKIVQLDTGIGTMPVAITEENFHLDKLKKGAFMVMVTDIKADFIK